MSADKATIKVMNAVTSPLSPSPFTLKPDDPQPEADPSTCPYPTYTCTVTRYRSYDGSCNNLQKPIIGRAFIPLKRNLPADYGDGKFFFYLFFIDPTISHTVTSSWKFLEVCVVYMSVLVSLYKYARWPR